MQHLFAERPLLALVSGLVAGCILAVCWQVQVPLWLLYVVPVVLLAAVKVRSNVLFGTVLWLFCVVWAIYSLQPLLPGRVAEIAPGLHRLSGTVVVEGTVRQRPLALPQGQRFELQAEQLVRPNGTEPVNIRLLVTVAQGEGAWLSGDRIRVRGAAYMPRRLGLPGEFDYPRYLALHRINATMWVEDARLVVLMQRPAGFSLQRLLDRAAQGCDRLIRQAVPDPAASAVVMALVTGSQAAIPADVKTAYARAGVAHILSISGFHVAVIAATLSQLLVWLLVRWQWLALRLNARRVALLATLPAMAGYLLFTGAAPATVRSVVMLAVVVLALCAERESEVLDALLLAALVLLIHDPAVLFDISFQLSFLSLWGIVVVTPLLLHPLRSRLSGWKQPLALFFAASVAAVVTTAVPTLASFHQATFTGLLANFVVVPLAGYGAVVIGAVAAVTSAGLPALSGWLFGAAGWLVGLSNRFVFWIADLPLVRSYKVGWLDLLAVVVVLSVLSFVKSMRWRGLLLGSTCVVVIAAHGWPEGAQAGRLRVTLLSVGQAEAILLQFPDQSTMLIDGGGYLNTTGTDFGERYLVPALYTLGVKQLDRLVLTHPHPDHLGGLAAVVEQFRVGEFWQGPWTAAGEGDAGRLQSALARRSVAVRQFQPGIRQLFFGRCRLTLLQPLHADGEYNGDNEASLVLRVDYHRFSALLMADAGHEAEQWMLGHGLQPATLLKVGHHGSRTATGEPFVQQVKPRVALLSVGAGNRFGLPAPETLERLRRCGAQIYRTDLDGTIQVVSDGNGYQVATGL